MYPILGQYGRFFLYSYTTVLALGILAGIGLTARQAQGRPQHLWLNAFLVAFIAAMLGGRLGFVWHEWHYFQERPYEIWQLWQGGYAYHTALITALAALWLWARYHQLSFGLITSWLTPAFALVQLAGWIACWLEACAYGRSTLPGLLAADLPDQFGVFDIRYQTQLMGIIWHTAVLFFTLRFSTRLPPTARFWATLTLISFGRSLISPLRGDPTFHLSQWRLDTLLDITLAILSLILLQYTKRGNHETKSRTGTNYTKTGRP
ncbi:MAG: hypothetical protein D6706_16675 [Chloroflexi bacterium]|nr:MAG: hypothetical protein D6706_16675 [Chloroflexota bacterium]